MREFAQQEKTFMRCALQEAESAFEKKEIPIGAVIVYENRVIASAHNQVESLKEATAHAEILCLKEATKILGDWRLINTTLYVTVEPCIMCAGAAILSRVQRIIWGCSDKRHGAFGGLINLSLIEHPIHQIESIAGLMEEESKKLMQTFFQQRRQENREYRRNN